MDTRVRRIFVEKKKGCDIEANKLLYDLKENLNVKSLKSLRIVNRYDISGLSDEEYELSRCTVFSEPPVDNVYDESIDMGCARAFAVEYLPGQYDQRADSAGQCIQILTMDERPIVRAVRLILLEGDISDEDFDIIKAYCINSVDSREASLGKPDGLEIPYKKPFNVENIEGFIGMSEDELLRLHGSMGFAMSIEDLIYCQSYFKDVEKRNPTITEIRVIDTYWSDHCRHTTFNTVIDSVVIEDGQYHDIMQDTYKDYLKSRELLYKGYERDITLMDIATIAAKEMKAKGMIPDLDISDEINACSIKADVDDNGKNEQYYIMFKNETHNHPTEIEPFGGAATCLGGAIRDPLSGRAYVYQAMRVTGSGDPRAKIEDTLSGKLPQRKITTGAASGYSSYGNQVGLATGLVSEIYDEGFVTKRMEIGAVIGAVPAKNMLREIPCEGDRIVLLGGRTGRDGCGGATGSSKEHNEESILSCGAEVQKGNPPEERKIQRLFRNPKASSMIKRCNDFGAGGVSVAIGELADGLVINLDAVPKKYEGLDGTELAISESQERMAVVLDSSNVEGFIGLAGEENLEAVEIARVTGDKRFKMIWNDRIIVDIDRGFLNTNGVKQRASAYIKSPETNQGSLSASGFSADLKERWLQNLEDLNTCSQMGLVERFDSTIGAGTVLMPFGGRYRLTPSEVMAAKIPVLSGDTSTGTLMSYGYDPKLSKWSPFHGSVYAVVDAVAKVVAAGGDYRNIRLTLQEYFEKLGSDPVKWGKPLSALLGAYYAQKNLNIPAIGGKDSMSGTFKDLNVPPTLVAFAVSVIDIRKIISPEFKKAGSSIVLIKCIKDENGLPVFSSLMSNYSKIHELIGEGRVLSSHTVGIGGIAASLSKMAFGNKIGVSLKDYGKCEESFCPDYGSVILEIGEGEDLDSTLKGTEYKLLGYTIEKAAIEIGGICIDIDEAISRWEKPLEGIFPAKCKDAGEEPPRIHYSLRNQQRPRVSSPKPRVFIPVFPGTNCEYDTAKAFREAGGEVDLLVVRNLSPKEIKDTMEEMARRIRNSEIIAIPGGFSGGDEPDGSGKFIAAAFRSPWVSEAVMELLNKRDGLMIGICNGFQALIKLGLLPYGEIREMDENSPTLTFNTIGRHVSRMVNTKVVSTLSPWFNALNVGNIHTVAVSHGEGRFIANEKDIETMIKNGQIATQYVDCDGNPSGSIEYNPNGSLYAVEGITSPDGRILGKMGHSERFGNNVCKNVPGEKDQKIFQSGIHYFK